MPVYEFDCEDCINTQDEYYKIEECPKEVKCNKCGGKAVKVIGKFNLQCDGINDIPWLPSAVENLQKDGEKPIESRSEYKRYLKENGLIAKG